MIDERKSLEKACESLDQAVRKAYMLSLETFHSEQKKKEAALWHAAWLDWNVSLEEKNPQDSEQRDSASSKTD